MTVAQRREREREERKNAILDAAQRVFYARGYDLTTMEEVAEEAQLAKGTLYLYFCTKQDLLMAVAMRHQQRLIAKFEQASREQEEGRQLVRRLLRAYANHMSEKSEHLRMVMSRWVQATPLDQGHTSAGKMRENAERILGIMRAAVERGQADGSIRPELEPLKLCLQLWSAVNGALLFSLQTQCFAQPSTLTQVGMTVDDMIDLVSDAMQAHGPVSGQRLAQEAE